MKSRGKDSENTLRLPPGDIPVSIRICRIREKRKLTISAEQWSELPESRDGEPIPMRSY
jgi:hypothetical protein